MASPKVRTIVLVAYLSGDAGRAKCAYLEKVDAAIQAQGYRLLLIDQGGQPIETTCMVEQIPEGIDAGEYALTDAMRTAWASSAVLRSAVEMDAGYFGIDSETAARKTLSAAGYIREVLEREDAALCILWHQFNGVSLAVAEHCKAVNLPYLFAHLGPLPGTIIFEPQGQMAESRICTENERFLALPVSDDDLTQAQRYLDHLRETRADRKAQTEDPTITQAIGECRTKYNHVVFYAGQNDLRSGITPNSYPNKALHSPFLDNTAQGLTELKGWAQAHHCCVLAKPHPLDRTRKQLLKLHQPDSGIQVLEGANIFECLEASDVVVTILSTSSYLALIHGKPVVLLGKSLLNGKGCCYEVDTLEALAPTLDRALSDGFTEVQQERWLNHVAQLIRYYLFAYSEDAESRIGRGPACAAAHILESINRPG